MQEEHAWKWYPNPEGPRAVYHRKVLSDAVGLSDPNKDFAGRTFLIVGNEEDIGLVPALEERGAKVTAIPMEAVGNRSTRKAVLNSIELKAKYDEVLLPFSSGFYQGGNLQKLLKKTIQATNLRKDGAWTAVALDWETYDQAARTSADVRLTRLIDLTEGFFDVAKFDRGAGKTLIYETERAVNRTGLAKKVDVDEHIDSRPKGKRIHEVEELVRMFMTIIEKDVLPAIQKAPGFVRKGLTKKLDLPGWNEYHEVAAGLMQKSEAEQPSLTPPSAVTVRIRPHLKLEKRFRLESAYAP